MSYGKEDSVSPEAGSTAAPPFTVSFIFFDLLSPRGVRNSIIH